MLNVTANVYSPEELRATANYLDALAAIRDKQQRIKPEDNPEAGAPLPPIVDPAEVFKAPTVGLPSLAVLLPDTGPTAAQAFGAPAASVPLPPPAAAPALPVPPASTASGTAPAASAAPVSPSGKQLDSRGLPHDGRIHSTPPTITDKGVWRKKRGLNDEGLVKRIEAELLAAMAAPAPVAMVTAAGAAVGLPVPPVAASVPLPPPVPAVATVAATAPVSSPVASGGAGSVAPAAPPADPASPTTLPDMMRLLAPMMAIGATDLPRITAACNTVGLPSLAVLGTRPDLVPSVWAKINEAPAVPV